MVKKTGLKDKPKVPIKKKESKSKNIATKSIKKDSTKETSSNTLRWIVGLIIVIVVIVVAVLLVTKKQTEPENKTYNTIEELNSKVNSGFKQPEDSVGATFGVEKGDIARMDYEVPYGDGHNLRYTLRSSPNQEDNMAGLTDNWGTKIVMTVICKDGSDVEVESYVSTDNVGVMKANWFDNDKYYMMTTDNLVTREDFLQEVNRVVIANHEEF